MNWRKKMGTNTLNKIEKEIKSLPVKEQLSLVEKIIHNMNQKKEVKNNFNPSKYRGLYKNLKIDIKKETKMMREEWERNI
jgi:hypothetical protein